jgi:cysteine-rich repeat protein
MPSAPRSLVAVLLAVALAAAGCSPGSSAGPACGDGHLDPGEACDDGNRRDGDGCSATCQIERPALDCAGTPGGTAHTDHCGRCVGGTTGATACTQDCAGAWGGTAALDHCGQCTDGTTGATACTQDCAGAWGGTAALDHCGQCTGGTSGAVACTQDCTGTWGGEAALDHCGTCAGGATGVLACVQDCAGAWGGAAALDHCSRCTGGTSGAVACLQDCAGVWGGRAAVDHCGTCAGGATGVPACAQDCAGVWGGAAALDHCGRCTGGTSGAVACLQDCAGVWGGRAAVDHCGACAGGTTGTTACAQDCAGVWGGLASLDHCGACVRGTTGATACAQDCAGAWGGSAAPDACSRCTGGATGRAACAGGVCRLGPGETLQGLVDNPACLVVEVPAGPLRAAVTVDLARMGGKQAVEVRGAGRDATVLGSAGQQVFWVHAGATLGLRALAIRGAGPSAGAALYNEGTAALDDVAVSDNTGVVAGPIFNDGQLEIRGSLISGNVVPSTSSMGLGGAIYNRGALHVAATAITGNRALASGVSYGGGLCNDGGDVVIEDSDLGGNEASTLVPIGGALQGGGLFSAFGTVAILRSRLHDNRVLNAGAGAYGGGIAVQGGTLSLSADSEVSANEVGATYDAFGAGIYLEQHAQATLDGATLAGNVGRAGVNLSGAAVMAVQASLHLAGNRLDDNRLEVTGAYPGTIAGGVLDVLEGTLTMVGGRMVGNAMVGGAVLGGLARVAEYASPSEVDEALTLDGVLIADNQVSATSVLEGGLISAVGTLRLAGCDVHSNHVSSTAAYGLTGGLVAYRERVNVTGPPVPAELVLDGTRMDGNVVTTADGAEGGLLFFSVERTGPVAPTLLGATFIGNAVTSAHGWIRGGLFYFEEPRQVRIRETVISGNSVDDGVPGVTGGRAATIHGGVLYLSFTGGAFGTPVTDGLLELVRTDLSRNRVGAADATDSIQGGLVMLDAPWQPVGTDLRLVATNSTLSGNAIQGRAPANGGLFQVFNRAGADVHLDLANVTLALNQTGGPLGAVFDFEYPPEDYRPVVVSLRNSLLTGNLAAGLDCPMSGPLAQTTSAGFNLLGGMAGCPRFAPAATDLEGLDPLLGPYGDVGGATFTLQLLPGSPAIDGGDPAGCADGGGALLTTDQRGLPRPSGPRCDIGAFELQVP